MNLLKSITAKIKKLLQAKIAKKYAAYYEACIQSILTAAFKTLKHADTKKTESMVNDAQMIYNEIRDFWVNHKDFIKETANELIKNIDTTTTDKRMKDVVKVLEGVIKA